MDFHHINHKTVGRGLFRKNEITAGRELHPALKIFSYVIIIAFR